MAIRAAIAKGSDEVQKLGGARKGDRTMVDVLEALRESPDVRQAVTLKDFLEVCLREATKAAAATAQLPAKFGRSRYLSGKEVGQKDPGAELVVLWIKAVADKYAHPNNEISQKSKY
ncbi:unnamed protein product [Phytomonas sp. EM1]|nr:unnamed protein product [Phytomonas sp. EM1]|eukprot:CCW65738.1 unnamed protein product [Phytomonas sp. isolate EM1]